MDGQNQIYTHLSLRGLKNKDNNTVTSYFKIKSFMAKLKPGQELHMQNWEFVSRYFKPKILS